MQNSIIKEMFYGNCGNFENIKRSKLEDKFSDIYCEMYKNYTLNFTEEQKEKLDKLINAHEDLWSEIAEKYYLYGFKLGILIGVDCLDVFDDEK